MLCILMTYPFIIKQKVNVLVSIYLQTEAYDSFIYMCIWVGVLVVPQWQLVQWLKATLPTALIFIFLSCNLNTRFYNFQNLNY